MELVKCLHFDKTMFQISQIQKSSSQSFENLNIDESNDFNFAVPEEPVQKKKNDLMNLLNQSGEADLFRSSNVGSVLNNTDNNESIEFKESSNFSFELKSSDVFGSQSKQGFMFDSGFDEREKSDDSFMNNKNMFSGFDFGTDQGGKDESIFKSPFAFSNDASEYQSGKCFE